jgi:hypothetical protein
MRALPYNFDLGDFVNQQLTQLRIGTHQLQLAFEGEYVIACEGAVVVERSGQRTCVFGEDGWEDLAVLKGLTGQNVLAWSIEGEYEFSITLTSGTKLRFESTDRPYEDFVIYPQGLVV